MENETKARKKRREQRIIRIFWGALIAPTLLWLVICLIGTVIPSLRNSIDYDLGENRNLAKWPTTLSSDYCSLVEAYYNDHMPFRSILIDTGDRIGFALEKPYETGIKPVLVSLFHPTSATHAEDSNETETALDFASLFPDTASETDPGETGPSGDDSKTQEHADGQDDSDAAKNTASDDISSADSVASDTADVQPSDSVNETEGTDPEPVSENEAETAFAIVYPEEDVQSVIGDIDTEVYVPPVVKNDYTLIGRGDWLFLYGNANIDYYLGNYRISDETLQTYLASMVNLNEICKTQGKQLVYLIPPSKEEVYSEYMPTYEISNTYKRPNQIVDYIQANSDVKICYPIEELKAIKPYYLAYLKYDTHWNYIGAFIGYQMILQMLDMPTTNLLSLYVASQPSSYGDLIAAGSLNQADYTNDRVYTIAYKCDILPTSQEGVFAAENEIFRETSDAESGKSIVLIGDSYRTHMEPYVYRDFSDVTYIHVNLLGDPTADAYIKAADVIAYVYVERNDNFIVQSTDYVANLLSQ